MATPERPTAAGTDRGASEPPLNGWKEIAAYFARGVRTVQRWERELHLPVHRLPGPRGETVFAFPSELSAWREQVERRAADGGVSLLAENADEERQRQDTSFRRPEPAPPRKLLRPPFRLWSVLLVVVVVVLAALLARRFFSGDTLVGPVAGEVRGDTLVTYDARGAFLWSHRFPAPLQETTSYSSAAASERLMAFADIDGDGRVETLFFAVHPPPTPSRFYCFESNGALRFVHDLKARHRYGNEVFTGPWRAFRLLSDSGTLRAGEIWLVWIHGMEFPSVLEKLDARGRSQGEFWNAGYIHTLVPVVRGGRRLMLAGGTNNEWKTAFLALLDRVRPSGSMPGINDKYMCADCPSGRPERYLLFPRVDLDAADGRMSYVTRIEPDEEGQTLVAVEHGTRSAATFNYRFDRDFRLLRSEPSPEYVVLKRDLERQHRLPLRAGEQDPLLSRDLRQWNGSTFMPLSGPPPQ